MMRHLHRVPLLLALLLRWTGVVDASCPGDFEISVISPMENVVYASHSIMPRINVVALEGPVSIDVRSRPADFSLCYEWRRGGHGGGDGAEGARCLPVVESLVLEEVLLSRLPEGHHAFTAWLSDSRQQGEHHGRGQKQAEARRLCATSVPFSAGLGSLRITPATRLVSFFHGHDAHVAVATGDGQVEFVLELERLLGVRYFDGCHLDVLSRPNQTREERADEIERAWAAAGSLVLERAGILSAQVKGGGLGGGRGGGDGSGNGGDGGAFDVGIFEMIVADMSMQEAWAARTAMRSLPARRWVQVSHHQSHAALGLWDARHARGITRPLILSFDGGGDDGTTAAFAGDATTSALGHAATAAGGAAGGGGGREVGGAALVKLELPAPWPSTNFGAAYEGVAAVLPEVAKELTGVCLGSHQMGLRGLALAGKMMGYSALGASRVEWRSALHDHYRSALRVGRGHDGEFCNFDTGALAFPPNNATDRILRQQPSVAAISSSYDGTTAAATTTTTTTTSSLSSVSSPSLSSSSRPIILTRREQRDLAASAQAAFEEAVLDLLEAAWAANPPHYSSSPPIATATPAAVTGAAVSSSATISSPTFSVRRKSSPSSESSSFAFASASASAAAAAAASASAAAAASATAAASESAPRWSYDGIVLTGGCALNVLANSRIQRAFRPVLPVHIAAAPSDCGLAVGALWIVAPPTAPQRSPLQYAGLPLWDAPRLNDIARKFGARLVTAVDDLAALLADDQIIGVARGRAEHGPRALGHRSLLAVPSDGMRARLNHLKHREWFRPVAPVVLDADADRVFRRDRPSEAAHSPYMSFAPLLTEEAAAAMPAIVHFDATARPQTVSAADDPWLHALLRAVQRRVGWGVLINTSFNSRGKPILNSAREALALLRDCRELDFVLVEDWLFSKEALSSATDVGFDFEFDSDF